MIIMAQMAVIGALVGGATALIALANIDVNVNISLNGVVQTGDTATRGRISTKDVIQAVQPGALVKAKRLLRSTVGGGGPFFVVRDGDTDTDIGAGTLDTSRVGDAVVVTTDRNGVITEKTVEIRRFVLNSATLSFDVQGYTSSSGDNKGLTRGEIFETTNVSRASAKVSGTMVDSGGNHGVVQGTVSVSGRKITEVP